MRHFRFLASFYDHLIFSFLSLDVKGKSEDQETLALPPTKFNAKKKKTKTYPNQEIDRDG